MIFIPSSKATVLIPTPKPDRPNLQHLFICLNRAMAGLYGEVQDGVMVVSVSSVPPNGKHDKTCLLYKGDHPFIKHDSYVFYRGCQVKSAASLLEGVKNKVLQPHTPMDDLVFARVLAGVPISGHTPNEMKDAYRIAYPQG